LPASTAKPKAKAGSKLEFSVDARLELDGVMELLAFDLTAGAKGKPHATDFMHPDIEYVRAARKYFAPYKNHPAIKHRALNNGRLSLTLSRQQPRERTIDRVGRNNNAVHDKRHNHPRMT
jgi:hypothetical protein